MNHAIQDFVLLDNKGKKVNCDFLMLPMDCISSVSVFSFEIKVFKSCAIGRSSHEETWVAHANK